MTPPTWTELRRYGANLCEESAPESFSAREILRPVNHCSDGSSRRELQDGLLMPLTSAIEEHLETFWQEKSEIREDLIPAPPLSR